MVSAEDAHSAERHLDMAVGLAAAEVPFEREVVPALEEDRSVLGADIWGRMPVLDLLEVCRMSPRGILPRSRCCKPLDCRSHFAAAGRIPVDTDRTAYSHIRRNHSHMRFARGSRHAAGACSSCAAARTPRVDRTP